MERGITETKRPPRYNEEFIFPDMNNPLRDAMLYTGKEMMISGPAGTGKTHAAVMKGHKMAVLYPGSVGVWIRKVKESIKRTITPTYYDILGYNPMISPGYVTGIGGTQPQEFHYRNGSIIFCVGMNDPKQLDSVQMDWAFVNQAEELEEKDWEILTIRNRGIKMPYRIVYGDCNPSYPEHFLCPYDENENRRESIYNVPTLHINNPLLYRNGEKTSFWTEYVDEALGKLTGLNYDRYKDGLWCFAEGAVFQEYDKKRHISKKQWRKGDFGSDWQWFRSIDYGSESPKVCQLWAYKPKEEYRLVQEIYQTKLVADDFYDMIMAMTQQWVNLAQVKWTAADHDGEATLMLEKKERAEKKHLRLRKAKKNERLLGRIELQKSYYANDMIKYNKNTLFHNRDESLVDDGLPYATPMEIGRYAYPQDKKGTRNDDVPVKGNDHGIDAQGYGLDEENEYKKPYEPLIDFVGKPQAVI